VLFLMALTLIAGSGWIVVTRVVDTSQARFPPAPQVGHPAPDFTLATTNDEALTLSQLKGKPVLLNFWATWCPPCRAEMPHIQAAYKEYGAAGLIVVAIDEQESADEVRRFANEFGLTFPLALDTSGQVGQKYLARALPTSFFVDRGGIIRHKFTGPMTEPILEERLNAIMR
jgi:DsbE subfamily thiol:disulfide oxidoreductase